MWQESHKYLYTFKLHFTCGFFSHMPVKKQIMTENKRMNESSFSPNKTGTWLHLMRFFYHKMESHWYCLKCGLEFIAFFLLLLNQFKSWAIIWVMKVYLLKKLHFSFCYSIEWKQIMFCKTLKR
jgi:hypothetical protein